MPFSVARHRLRAVSERHIKAPFDAPKLCFTEGQTSPGASLVVAFVRKASCFCLGRVSQAGVHTGQSVVTGERLRRRALSSAPAWSSQPDPPPLHHHLHQQETSLMAAPAPGSVLGIKTREMPLDWLRGEQRQMRTSSGFGQMKITSVFVRVFHRMDDLCFSRRKNKWVGCELYRGS